MPDVDDEQIGALLVQIRAYHASSNYAKMLSVSLELIAKLPDSYRGYQSAGQAQIGLKKYAEAAKLLNEALALEPESDFIHYLLAAVHRYRKQYQTAQKHIRKAVEMRPESAAYWIELAHLCIDVDDKRGAARYAHKALKLDPGNADALHLIALNTPKTSPKGQAQALEKYFKALGADPEDPYIHNNIGVVYLQQKNTRKAEQFFRQALAINPDEEIFRKNLYVALKQRSAMYQMLRAPGELAVFGLKHRFVMLLVFGIPWFFLRPSEHGLMGSPMFPIFVCIIVVAGWVVLFLPLIWFYQYLTIREIKKLAGEVGVDGAGTAVQRWPFAVRFGLFFVALAAVWTGIIALIASPAVRGAVADYGEDAIIVLFIIAISIGFLLKGRSRKTVIKSIAPPGTPNLKPKRTLRGRQDNSNA